MSLVADTAAQLQERAMQHLLRSDFEGAVRVYESLLEQAPERRAPVQVFAVAIAEAGQEVLSRRLFDALERAERVLYQRSVVHLRRSPYLDVPRQVHLETLARCNARCDFCPSPVLERTGVRMEDALIDKVIGDLQDVPAGVPFEVVPFKVNEPFLDVRLFDVLDAIAERLPSATVSLTTNGSALTRKKLAELGRRPVVEQLFVSFNDYRPDAYTRTMGLPWARTLERLDALHDAVALGSIPSRVTVSRVGDGSEHDRAFKAWVGQRWPAFGVLVNQRGDWLGQVDTTVTSIPDVGCVRWFELSITSTGEVAHCCMDGQARWPIGNVREQHVLDVYNAPDFRRLRERALSRIGEEPCGSCTFL